MKAVVAAFNQEKAPVGAFSVITNLRMELFEALVEIQTEGAMPSLFTFFPDTFIHKISALAPARVPRYNNTYRSASRITVVINKHY